MPDDSLDKLLAAASQAPPRGAESPPPYLEARVLARWRARPADDELAQLAALFRRAALAAGVVVVLSATWSYFTPQTNATGALALARYSMAMRLPP